MITSIFRWFYCLDLPYAVAIVLLGTLFFWWLESVVAHYRFWRKALIILLAFWGLLLVFMTVFSRNNEITTVNLTLFHSYYEAVSGDREIYRSNLMNVLLFFPGGLLATSLWPSTKHRFWQIVLSVLGLLAVSIGIEWAQYMFSLGRCEIDDVFHNTLGAVFGALAAVAARPLVPFMRLLTVRMGEGLRQLKEGLFRERRNP